ncbi:strictosidine synthase family protein [Thermodesulfobacteriota bacterium]
MKLLKTAAVILLLLILLIGGLIVKTFYDAGEFKEINPHFNGRHKVISGVLSSEDITIDPKSGMAFISSDDRRVRSRGGKSRQGAIYGLDLNFDFNTGEPKLRNLTEDFKMEFNPHGIGLWTRQDGRLSLFVVNHSRTGHSVEIFDYRGKKLEHRNRIQGDLMHSPNDVIPVGPKAFYVTNDHGSTTKIGRTVEDYLQLDNSFVLYYDGSHFHKVASGLGYANGINISRDGKMIYVTTTVGQKLHVYHRELKTGDLTPRHSIDLGTGADNIELDEKGQIWIGAHPKLLTFIKHSKNPKVLAPSQVLRVSIEESDQYRIEEIYLSEGEPLSASSVAAPFKDILLIGSVLDPRFLLCKLR